MNLLLLGASGQTGQELLAQSLQRGHSVTVLVRSPEKLATQHERLVIRIGQCTDPGAIRQALEGQTAVLSTLGARGLGELVGTRVITETAEALVPAMEESNVRRLIFLSAAGVGASKPYSAAPVRLFMGTILRAITNDKARGEQKIRQSRLDWTLVYPPSLSNGPRSGKWTAGEDQRIKGTAKISRADVADFMLTQLEDSSFHRRQAMLTGANASSRG